MRGGELVGDAGTDATACDEVEAGLLGVGFSQLTQWLRPPEGLLLAMVTMRPSRTM